MKDFVVFLGISSGRLETVWVKASYGSVVAEEGKGSILKFWIQRPNSLDFRPDVEVVAEFSMANIMGWKDDKPVETI